MQKSFARTTVVNDRHGEQDYYIVRVEANLELCCRPHP